MFWNLEHGWTCQCKYFSDHKACRSLHSAVLLEIHLWPSVLQKWRKLLRGQHSVEKPNSLIGTRTEPVKYRPTYNNVRVQRLQKSFFVSTFYKICKNKSQTLLSRRDQICDSATHETTGYEETRHQSRTRVILLRTRDRGVQHLRGTRTNKSVTDVLLARSGLPNDIEVFCLCT